MRLGSGATVAALPLAAALTAATQGWDWLVWTGAAAFFLVLALTFAPWLRGLNKLPPPLGAPRARITFTEVPQSHHQFGGSARVLMVGVQPSTRLDDAVVTFRFPRDMYVQWTDEQGNDLGVATLPLHDSPGPASWFASDQDIRAGSKLFYFVLRPKREDYPFSVALLIQSERLYRGEATQSHELELPREVAQ